MNTSEQRSKNTQKWLSEFCCGPVFCGNDEFEFFDERLFRGKSAVIFPQFGGVSALVLAFKKSSEALIVPISEYSSPACESEILLPDSRAVLQTWNARVIKTRDFGEMAVIGKVGDADFRIAEKHYRAVFENAVLDERDCTRIGLCTASIPDRNALGQYISEESQKLPERFFGVLFGGLDEDFFTEGGGEPQTPSPDAGNAQSAFVPLPGGKMESGFEMRNAAAANPTGNDKNKKNFGDLI